MSTLSVATITTATPTTPLILQTSNVTSASIKIESANNDVNFGAANIKASTISGNAAGNLLRDIITYNLALG